jgi:hypothetical protein
MEPQYPSTEAQSGGRAMQAYFRFVCSLLCTGSNGTCARAMQKYTRSAHSQLPNSLGVTDMQLNQITPIP